MISWWVFILCTLHMSHIYRTYCTNLKCSPDKQNHPVLYIQTIKTYFMMILENFPIVNQCITNIWSGFKYLSSDLELYLTCKWVWKVLGNHPGPVYTKVMGISNKIAPPVVKKLMVILILIIDNNNIIIYRIIGSSYRNNMTITTSTTTCT